VDSATDVVQSRTSTSGRLRGLLKGLVTAAA
jgi:hypothetical protein